MANINRVVLVGNLTKDPELKQTGGGTSICKLRIAVNTRRKDETGQWVDKPNYFDVTVWGNQAESCAQYLSKGRPVGVDGRLEWREWEATDGSGKRQAVEIVAESVQFLGSRGDSRRRRAAVRPGGRRPARAPTSPRPPPTTTSRSRRRGMAQPKQREERSTSRRRPPGGAAGSRAGATAASAATRSRRSTTRTSRPPSVHLGEGQDPLAPDHGRLPPAPGAGRRRGEARARDGPAPLRLRQLAHAGHPLQDVEKVGLRGEVVDVARGYARNFLLPRQLAETATPARVAELQKRSEPARPAGGVDLRAGEGARARSWRGRSCAST